MERNVHPRKMGDTRRFIEGEYSQNSYENSVLKFILMYNYYMLEREREKRTK